MSDSLTRCNALIACWVSVLGWTKRIDGREAALHMASASIKIILITFDKRTHELRRDKFFFMTDVADTPGHKMRTSAGFHNNY